MRSLEIVPAVVAPSRLPRPLAMPHAVVVRGAAIHADVTGSDHCPVSVDLAVETLVDGDDGAESSAAEGR